MEGEMSEHEQLILKIVDYVTGSLTANLAVFGEKMGIYKALNEIGPCTAEALAEKLDMSPRYILEWCRQQASAKLISTDEAAEKFWLSEVQKDVILRESGNEASPFFGFGLLSTVPAMNRFADKDMERLFRTGQGMTYDEMGEELVCGVCRELGVWVRHQLVPSLESTPSIKSKLTSGCLVADIGCGFGEASLTVAAAFPNSTFHGYDISEKSLMKARCAAKDRGLSNVEFFNPLTEPFGEDRYDLCITNDAIHDMAKPSEVTKIVRKAMKSDGKWIIGDMSAMETHADNIHKHPLASNLYGCSVHCCLPSGMSDENAEGLGTLGLSTSLADKILKNAGFSQVEVLDWEHPLNRYYCAHA